MKKANLPLIIGGMIVIIILFVMMFPQRIAKVNPYGIQMTKSWIEEDGKFSLEAPPYKPSKDAIWGTDEVGRDIYSLVIYGTRLTIFASLLIVLGRFIIAVPVGIAAGFGSYVSRTAIQQCSIIFSALPGLLIGIIILKMNFFQSLYKVHSIIAFTMVLTFIGWPKLGRLVMERVEEILVKPFIKGETAIGKSKLQIARENIIPHLAAELVVLFFMEIARALTMMMQLGVFGVFIGNLRIGLDTEGPITTFMNLSFEPEWASMLGTAKDNIRYAPWTVIYPGLAFFISILGFNLFGEGIRGVLQERNSKALRLFKRWLTMKNIGNALVKSHKKEKLIHRKIGIIVIVCIAFTGFNIFSNSTETFRYTDALDIFPYDFPHKVIFGTEEAKEMAVQISDALENLGLVPLHDEGFMMSYATGDAYIPISSRLQIEIEGEQLKTLRHGKDYSFRSSGDWELSGKLYDTTEENLLAVTDFSKFDDYFVLVDSSLYSQKAVMYITKRIVQESMAKGVLCIVRENEELPYSMGKEIYNGAIIWLTSEAASGLTKNHTARVSVSQKSRKVESTGYNVLGMLPGEDSKVGDEAIIFGMGYNFENEDKELARQRMLFAFQLIKKIAANREKQNRTIIFSFWDGSLTEEYNGLKYYCEAPVYENEKSVLYVDLTKLNAVTADELFFSSAQSPINRYFAFSFAYQLKSNFEKQGISVEEYDLDMNVRNKEQNILDKMMYFYKGIPTVILNMEKGKNEKNSRLTLDTLGEIIVKTVNKNNY